MISADKEGWTKRHILLLHPEDAEYGVGETHCGELVFAEEIDCVEVETQDEVENLCHNCAHKPPGYREND